MSALSANIGALTKTVFMIADAKRKNAALIETMKRADTLTLFRKETKK
jgi:hypothetical protein